MGAAARRVRGASTLGMALRAATALGAAATVPDLRVAVRTGMWVAEIMPGVVVTPLWALERLRMPALGFITLVLAMSA